jgi:hypothetical protein
MRPQIDAIRLADPAVNSEPGVLHDLDDHRRDVDQSGIRVDVNASPVECRVTESPWEPVRRRRPGRLTEYRREGTEPTVISDRCDVSQQVLERNHNQMMKGEKMEQRREYL